MKNKKSSLTTFRIIRRLLAVALVAVVLFYSMPFPGTLPVLMYHQIGTKENAEELGNFVSREAFMNQMAFLKKFGYSVISLDDYYAIKTGKKTPRGREIVITFDDGDVSFEKIAVPVLKNYAFPVTMFLVSEKIKTGQDGSMLLDSVLRLQEKYPWIDFESHSKTHWHLKEFQEPRITEELADSRKDLEAMLGKKILYFSYPFGEFDSRSHEAAQKAGYRIAFTTGFKRLRGTPEGLHAMTRTKIDVASSNPLVFWYQLSGLELWIKGTREKFRNLLQ